MKRIKLTIEDIFNIPTAEIINPDNFKPVSSVVIDSRNIVKNSLFVAVKGDRFDGHDFVRSAIKNGSTAVIIVKNKYKNFKDVDIPVVTVKDTTKALGDIAEIWRNKLTVKIIGITGSNGKTSTKEIIALLLNEKYSVNKTVGNNNNHIGVPLTIFSTNKTHEVLVLELGTNHFGEIEYTSNIAKPDYALITNIGDSHLKFLKDRKGVFREKEALFRITADQKGCLFINDDDVILKNAFKDYKRKIIYGFNLKNKNIEVKGKLTGYNNEGRPLIEISYKNKKIKQTLPIYGEHNASNYLAAVSVGFKLGLTKKEIEAGTKKIMAADKRLNVKKFNNYILVDDTYNANPESMKYALELLPKFKLYKRRIAVLGDMFELGRDEFVLHRKLASHIYKNKITELYTIGKRMKYLSGIINIDAVIRKHFKAREELKYFLSNHDHSDSVILVKGSRGMKMEEFVKVLEQN